MHTLRSIRVTALAALILSPALCICVRAQKVKDLKPQGYVDDFAGVLGSSTVDRLTTLCSEVDKKAQAQIAVVTVKALNGQSIEEFTIDLATHWGVGPKQQSRGVMILVAPHDRKYRIEVGYGLEGILPDGKVGSFGRQAVPYFQHQDFDGAVWLMTERVAEVIAQDKGITLDALQGSTNTGAPETSSRSPGYSLNIGTLIFIVFLLFPILGFILRIIFGGALGVRRYRRSGGWWMGGPWYGGGIGGGSWGGGGGFGGGGSFGGFGGGSFGGGGASGSW